MSYQIVWRGLTRDKTGFARASRGLALALNALGNDVKIEAVRLHDMFTVHIDEDKKNKIEELENKPYADGKKKILIVNSAPNEILTLKKDRENYDYIFVNCYWETTKIPKYWFPNINLVDGVFAPSEMNAKAYRDSGVVPPVFVVPNGVDTEDFNLDGGMLPLAGTDDTFNFLSVFHWQHRKAPEILLRAYWSEFTKEDNVAFIIKTYWHNSYEHRRQIIETIQQYKARLGFDDDTAPIYLTQSLLSEDDLKKFYRLGDVFVLPSRGEGVGLPFLEAMASGLPVISTAWGGQMDFLNEDNAYLVDYTLEPPTARFDRAISFQYPEVFKSDMLWAEPHISSLQEKMREAYTWQEINKSKAEEAVETARAQTWTKGAAAIVKALWTVIK